FLVRADLAEVWYYCRIRQHCQAALRTYRYAKGRGSHHRPPHRSRGGARALSRPPTSGGVEGRRRVVAGLAGGADERGAGWKTRRRPSAPPRSRRQGRCSALRGEEVAQEAAALVLADAADDLDRVVGALVPHEVPHRP